MDKIGFYFLKLFSKIPLSILYGVSDFLLFLQLYIIKYRKKIILTNITTSFPEMTEKEVQKTYKKFCAHLCDYAVESLRTISISPKELNRRITFENLSVFDEIKAQQKNCMILSGHIFNWEWLMATVLHLPTKNSYAVYHQVSNPAVDEFLKETRERFGTNTLKMSKVGRQMLRDNKGNESTYLFVADQSPYKANIHYTLPFLNQPTPVFIGYSKLAEKLNIGVVYARLIKEKRGKYIFRFEEIKPDGEKFKENEVTHKFFSKLEENIQEDPSNWLWSHRRWKYKKGIDY